MRIMKAWPKAAISLLVASMLVACEEDPVRVQSVPATTPAISSSAAVVKTPATGVFNQTAITSVDVQTGGGNTIIHQTAMGVISGTLTGHFADDLTVVIHPNGKFNARFTITCSCTVNGKFGIVEMVAEDSGELLSPTLAAFAGRAVIVGATGDLTGLRGVLQIEGTVDVTTSLATYGYTGDIFFAP